MVLEPQTNKFEWEPGDIKISSPPMDALLYVVDPGEVLVVVDEVEGVSVEIREMIKPGGNFRGVKYSDLLNAANEGGRIRIG